MRRVVQRSRYRWRQDATKITTHILDSASDSSSICRRESGRNGQHIRVTNPEPCRRNREKNERRCGTRDESGRNNGQRDGEADTDRRLSHNRRRVSSMDEPIGNTATYQRETNCAAKGIAESHPASSVEKPRSRIRYPGNHVI